MGGLRKFDGFVAALFASAILLTASCYSWRSTQIEFDSVAGYVQEEAQEPEDLAWGSRAMRLPWLYRQFEHSLVLDLAEASGVQRRWTEVGNPAAFASDRILWLAELAGDDLLKMGETSWRLLLVLDRDAPVLHRIYAAQGLRMLLETFGKADPGRRELRIVAPEHLGFQAGDAAEYRIAARALLPRIEGAWVGRRDDPELARGGREEYVQAVDELARLATGDLRQERLRLRLLLEAVRAEPFRPLQERLARSLVFALQVACVRGLQAALMDAEGAVRLAGFEALIRLGGQRLLPRLLALLESRPAALAAPGLRADPDPQLRRALALHYWSARAELAEERWEKGRSGFEFLYELSGSDPEPSLRILAADALAWLVRREADPFGEWIPEWWRSYSEEQRAATADETPEARGS